MKSIRYFSGLCCMQVLLNQKILKIPKQTVVNNAIFFIVFLRAWCSLNIITNSDAGDQAIALRASQLSEIGGLPIEPIFEDYSLMLCLLWQGSYTGWAGKQVGY